MGIRRIKFWKIGIYFRGWGKWPLLIIGKCTLWLSSGMSFGKVYNYGSNVIYFGWLIIRHSVPIVPKENRPKDRFWLVWCSK